MSVAGYDVVGDIHGYAAALTDLLESLNYRRRDGVWSHPERKVIFVGDFVDRGPENIRSCRIAMDMTAAGSALAVMGNHEFNAVALATPDPENPGAYLRPHTTMNLKQVATTHTEFTASPGDARQILTWMRSLPLWLDLPGLRVSHAGWSRAAQSTLSPYLDAQGSLTAEGFMLAARKGHHVRAAREILLNGVEMELPDGLRWHDKDGHERPEIRIAWWRAGQSRSLPDLAMVPEAVRATLPKMDVPEDLVPPDDDARPLVFGHYWMRAPLKPLTPRHACVDASVAGNGRLAAYKFSGEPSIDGENFCYA